MNLQDIEAFVAVAEAGSVNRAAARLNLTQPATTRRIQNFEAAIGGAPLFNRAVKPATLTSLGNHVLERCRRVLAAVAELEASTAKAVDPAGDLKAGVAHGLGEMVMTSPFDAVRRTFPRIRLQISSNWSTDLIEDIRSGGLDCAVGLLTEAHTVPPGITRIALGAEQVVIVAPAKLPAKPGRQPWRLRDLADKDWFLNPPGCGCRTALVKAFDRLQLPLRIAAEVFGEDLQLSLLIQSGGLGLVPRRLLEHSPQRQALQILQVSDFALPATVTLIRSATPGRFDPVIELLARELKSRLG
jgi:DNA-binding transcriptional LysR family regulator